MKSRVFLEYLVHDCGFDETKSYEINQGEKKVKI